MKSLFSGWKPWGYGIVAWRLRLTLILWLEAMGIWNRSEEATTNFWKSTNLRLEALGIWNRSLEATTSFVGNMES
jgi:hypothetical protein